MLIKGRATNMRRSFMARTTARYAGRAAVVPLMLLMAGCSGDDVQFEGKVFDLMGMNGATQRAAEPKMRERAPLVVPPSLDRIPEPGAAPESLSGDLASLNDPDRQKRTSRAELERQQAEYCKEHYELAKARGDDNADLARGPLGDCRASVLTAIQKWNSDDSDEDEQQ